MNISYDYYRIFYYVAKYGSFTKAAAALLNNQPNITRAVKALERELGCTLFARSNRGARLTPEGEKLYQHIAIAFQQIEAGEEEISLNKTLQKGIVSIAVSETALHSLLLPLLSEYRCIYPGVRIKISNCSTPQAISEMKDGLADFCLVTSPANVPSTMKSVDILHFRVVPVCGSNYTQLRDKKLSLAQLAQYPLISLNPKTKTYEVYSQWFAEHGVVFSPDIEVATTDQLLPLVKHNLGIAFIPEQFLQNEKDDSTFYRLRLDTEIPLRTICLITNKEKDLSIAAKKMIDLIRR